LHAALARQRLRWRAIFLATAPYIGDTGGDQIRSQFAQQMKGQGACATEGKALKFEEVSRDKAHGVPRSGQERKTLRGRFVFRHMGEVSLIERPFAVSSLTDRVEGLFS
jgi:hypothetical protein